MNLLLGWTQGNQARSRAFPRSGLGPPFTAGENAAPILEPGLPGFSLRGFSLAQAENREKARKRASFPCAPLIPAVDGPDLPDAQVRRGAATVIPTGRVSEGDGKPSLTLRVGIRSPAARLRDSHLLVRVSRRTEPAQIYASWAGCVGLERPTYFYPSSTADPANAASREAVNGSVKKWSFCLQ